MSRYKSMRKVVQCILLKTMADLAVLEDIVNGAIQRERVFRDREDLLAHDGKWLISHFEGNPPGIVRRAAAGVGAQHGEEPCAAYVLILLADIRHFPNYRYRHL